MNSNQEACNAWAVIGAGPAGILTVGKLLDSGVSPSSIVWIDPEFQVGDLGAKWGQVSSNTNVALLLKSLNSSPSFLYNDAPIDFAINHLPPNEPCDLALVVEPLHWITNHLLQKVKTRIGTILSLKQDKDGWCLLTEKQEYLYAKNVVLATGAESIVHPSSKPLIPVETAMDISLLRTQCHKQDVIGVIGSSHSAIVALYNLVELNVSRIINFYRSPLRYAVDMGDYILNDNTGLRGFSAKWARQYLGPSQPEHLERICINSSEYELKLQGCTKIIQAIGFKQRSLPKIQPYGDLSYNPFTGILAPGLFGTGFGYPAMVFCKPGLGEYAIGIWDFALQLDEVLPLWLRYGV